MKFYRTARWRKRLGLKFNLEQLLLPSELCKAHGSKFTITFGKPISVEGLKQSGKNVRILAQEIRDKAYSLARQTN